MHQIKNLIRLHLRILISLILSSAAEEAPSVASLSVLNCDGSFFRDEYYDLTKTAESLGKVNLTLLIIWEGQTQLSTPKFYFFDFESRSFSKTNLNLKYWSDSIFGQIFSRGNERIYIPWADDPRDISRPYFERYLLESVNSFRFIVLFDPELPGVDLSADSMLALTRLFSVLNETFEINLVLTEDPGYTATRFYNFTHHSAHLREIFNSCRNCVEYYIRRWIVRKDELNKNFPAIRYGKASVKSVEDIFVEKGVVTAEDRYELEKVTCLLLRTFADTTWELEEYSQFYFSDWGYLYNVTEKALFASTDGERKKSGLRKSNRYNAGYKKIKPKRPRKSPAKIAEATGIQDIKDALGKNPSMMNEIGKLLPEENEGYYEYKLDGYLQGVFLLDGQKEKKKILTGVHNVEDLDDVPYVIPNAVITCLGDLMVITGENVQLNVNSADCPFRMILVRASDAVELTRSIHLPGKSLFIYSPLVRSIGSHVINLSGRNCLDGSSGEDGGNFSIYMDKYEGSPLKVVSDGGKGCSSFAQAARSVPVEAKGSECHRPEDLRDNNLAGVREESGGKKGNIVIFSADPSGHVIAEASDGDGGEPDCEDEDDDVNGNWKKFRDKRKENDFVANLVAREKIQVFIGHIIGDKSLDGNRVIDQARILENYARSTGYNGREYRMYDPFGEPVTESTPSALQWLAMQNDKSQLNPGRRSGSTCTAEQCFLLTIDNYEIECAIDLTNGEITDLSEKVLGKLRNASEGVTGCLQINLAFVSEFDLVLCNLSAEAYPHETAPLLLGDGFTCYRTCGGTVSCHSKKPDCDFNAITELAVDFAFAILTVRHIQVNPLKMIRAPLDYPLRSVNLDALGEIYGEMYSLLLADLKLFYEKVLKPEAELAIAELLRKMFQQAGNSSAAVDALRWITAIKTKILKKSPETFDFARMSAEVVLPFFDVESLPLLHDLQQEIQSGRMFAFALYVKIVKSELDRSDFPSRFKGNISAILENYSNNIEDIIGADAEDKDGPGINLGSVTSLIADFRRDFLILEASLRGEYLREYRRSIGKYIGKQDEMLDAIQSVASAVGNEQELHHSLAVALELAEKTHFKPFDNYFKLSESFGNAISEPGRYLNKLFVNILQNLDSERSNLMNLKDSSRTVADLKSKFEIALDLELEVYKALQAVRRVEDVKSSFRKLPNCSERLAAMCKALNESAESLALEIARNEFRYRMFPFSGDLEPQEYEKYIKKESFPPKNCNRSCRPFYYWSVRDIQSGGQDVKKFYRGDPLYLVADSKNGFPGVVRSNDFRIRMVPKALEERVKGTGVLLQSASFSYTSFRNEKYLNFDGNRVFKHVLGDNSAREIEDRPSISPYTMWRVQLMNVSDDFDSIENYIDGIELVGEGKVVADDVDLPDTADEPEAWNSDDVHLTLLQSM